MRTRVVLLQWLSGAAVMAIGIASTIVAPARAQQDFPEFSTYQLFPDADSVQPKADVIRRLADTIRTVQPPAPCALGRLKIRTPQGDDLFQRSIAAARESAVLRALNGLGVPVAGRLFVESTVFGGSGGHDTVFETPLDRKPPKLTPTSVPRKGSKEHLRCSMACRTWSFA